MTESQPVTDQREQIIAECRAMFNDVCIVHDSEIARLVGFHEDDTDYYYRLRSIRWDRNRDYFSTCVGCCVSLKGALPADRYAAMDKVLTLNGAPPAEEFIISKE